jgi:hypothetical protein
MVLVAALTRDKCRTHAKQLNGHVLSIIVITNATVERPVVQKKSWTNRCQSDTIVIETTESKL